MSPKATKEKIEVTKQVNDQNWWHTIPGVLTGLAGTITAATGLVIALNQVGIIKSPERNEYSAPSSSPEEGIKEPANKQTERSIESGVLPSKQVQAVIADTDGYTNVREGQGDQFKVIDRVEENEVFYTIPQLGDWWPVETESGELGYIHRSRIKTQN